MSPLNADTTCTSDWVFATVCWKAENLILCPVTLRTLYTSLPKLPPSWNVEVKEGGSVYPDSILFPWGSKCSEIMHLFLSKGFSFKNSSTYFQILLYFHSKIWLYKDGKINYKTKYSRFNQRFMEPRLENTDSGNNNIPISAIMSIIIRSMYSSLIKLIF
jgi:hypothetical protein